MLYFWIALGAFLFKAYWWFESSKYEWANRRWYFLISTFSLMNLSECLIYNIHLEQKSPDLLLLMYYLSVLFACVAIYYFVSNNNERVQRNISFIILGVACCMAPAFIFTDFFIIGYQSGSYPVKSIKGDYFYFALIYLLFTMILTTFTVLFNICKSTAYGERIESIYHLCSFGMFLICGIIISICMLLEIDINGSALFPIATSLFLAITVWHKCRGVHGLASDPRRYLPFTHEWNLAKKINKTVYGNSIDGLSLKESLDEAEKSLITYHIHRHKTKSALAKALKLSRQSLDNRLTKYGLSDYFK